jgi:D-tyrosyl-tRNA(Tyr) deacylase
MKAVTQRVLEAKVIVNKQTVSSIQKGLLTLICFEKNDALEDLDRLLLKLSKLRIFEDEAGKMNLSLLDLKLPHILVSQFTLSSNVW